MPINFSVGLLLLYLFRIKRVAVVPVKYYSEEESSEIY